MKPSTILPSPVSLAATLIAACMVTPLVAGTENKPSRVVLVHGIFQSGRMFGPVVRMLEARGCECLVPKLTPADARQGIQSSHSGHQLQS